MIVISPALIVICGAVSVFLIVLSAFPANSPMAARIKKLERVSEKSVSARVTIIEQIVSKERKSRVQHRLIEAGWYGVTPLAMTMRGTGALGIGIVAGLSILLVFRSSAFGIVIGVFTALVGWRIPSIMLARAVKARKEEIQRELPDFLDLLATTVQAGLALNAALVQAVDAVHGALKEELTSMLAEIRLGRPRADAFNALAERVNEDSTSTMVTAIVQAERLGANLSEVLQELAKEVRDRRWMHAEERAAQLPIKMIIPMALFMIPSLYLMIFGPVIARLVTNR
ncbi:MAG: Type secretion system domain protein [Candidatus Eremiobacteraeota bacterium]|jgi:tight adherence protein C|nr:Type secretion system domain protein [Candidatus Eremiobacteraeota bacterium]